MFDTNRNISSPIIYSNHISNSFPIRAKLFLSDSLCTPKTFGLDGIISYSGATSKGVDVVRKAYGEFFERNHFFLSVPIAKRGLLDQNLLKLCDQMLLKNANPASLPEHKFALTKVHNLFNHSEYFYPYNLISLHGDRTDVRYINFNDSCACSSHTSKEKALYNSLMEFIERQALLSSWMMKRVRYRVTNELLLKLIPYKELLNNLLKNGKLYIFETGMNLPCYTITMFYLSNTSRDIVKYSIGSSSDVSLQKALISSFEELWQCYLFQYNSENTKLMEEKSGSGYHLKFMECNNLDTYKIIPFIAQGFEPDSGTISEANIHDFEVFTYDRAVEKLAEISKDIYYYHGYDEALKLHFTKIISYDFFTHMSLDQALNLNNKYAQACNIKDPYLVRIPFP